MDRPDGTARGQCRTGGGFTLLEVLLVVAMLAVLAAISVPLVTRVLAQSKAQGGADAIAGAIRDARVRALKSGWQYRVIGYSAGGTVPNSFRIEGRNPAASGWPAASDARVDLAASFAERWTSLSGEFGGTQVTTDAGTMFVVTFDSTGIVPSGGCVIACITGFPIGAIAPGGTTHNIQVNVAGTVRR